MFSMIVAGFLYKAGSVSLKRTRKSKMKRIRIRHTEKLKEKNLIKVGQGVDPKSVFCAFFKQGLCKKGDK